MTNTPIHDLFVHDLVAAESDKRTLAKEAECERQKLVDALTMLRNVVEKIFRSADDPTDADEIGDLRKLVDAIDDAEFRYTISARERSYSIRRADQLRQLLDVYKTSHP